jgi:DNA-binding LytR/AlgR family response regulator
MIKAVVIDSNPESLQIISDMISPIENVEVEKTTSSLPEAVKYINKFPVDLCIVEINSRINKNEMLFTKLQEKTRLIAISNSAEYAVDAFNINATDFLLKPLSETRFMEAIDKVKDYFELRRKSVVANDHFYIRADYSLVKIHFDDILYIEGLDDYLKIHLATSKIIVARCTLKSISEKLLDRNFIRVHRSFIVPLQKIHTVTRRSVSINENVIPIGDRYVNNFYSALPIHATA